VAFNADVSIDRQRSFPSWQKDSRVLSQFVGYAKCVGLLVALPMAWNIIMAPCLPRAYAPETFSSNIPGLLTTTESTLRIMVVALPFLAPLELISSVQKMGAATFWVGLAIYVISWVPLIITPNSAWSRSAAGFLAPAYTPIIWLVGLALLMQRLQWASPYRWWFYLMLSVGFVAAHVTHAFIVFGRVSHTHSGP
jgi:hypothetical protein